MSKKHILFFKNKLKKLFTVRCSLNYCLLLTILIVSCTSSKMTQKNTPTFDWQGHRGCRGLMPENSIPGFLHALTFDQITTLEMDVCVSKDGQIFVSHEPWMNHEIATKPSGIEVSEAESMKINTFLMNYADIKQYDCGLKVHPRFLEQQKIKAYKPLLSEVVSEVRTYCKANNKPFPQFNIELKSDNRGDDLYQPKPAIFAKMVLEEVKKLNIANSVCLQSFDVRCLNELYKLDKNRVYSLLVENTESIEKNLQYIDFKPTVYSCYFKLLKKEDIEYCHKKDIRVIPWTVNSSEDMENLIKMGVDGIITDYPNLIKK